MWKRHLVSHLFFCDEWVGDLFEPVYGAEQRYCGSAEHGET